MQYLYLLLTVNSLLYRQCSIAQIVQVVQIVQIVQIIPRRSDSADWAKRVRAKRRQKNMPQSNTDKWALPVKLCGYNYIQ